jgi:hypothetical protein
MNIVGKKKAVALTGSRITARRIRLLATSAVVCAVALTGGCAGTAPKPQFSHEIVSEARVAAADDVQVDVSAASNVAILPQERTRLAQKIKLRIDAKKLSNPHTGEPRTYEVDLLLSRYEKGSAFARAMLAGLGQIHINGVARVYQMPEHNLVAEFDLAKTFAWGGVYGASTSIEDVENAFADGVAAAITDQQAQRPKQKT